MLTEEQKEEIQVLGIYSIDAAALEFRSEFKQGEAYQMIPMLPGMCYRWRDQFIFNCLLAMSTDTMVQFTPLELEAWRFFVNFENYHSHSALDTDCHGLAIGCTNPDPVNKSFVVCGEGTITETPCQNPGFEIEGEEIWKSLDSYFMALYNCTPPNMCTSEYDWEDISPCTI